MNQESLSRTGGLEWIPVRQWEKNKKLKDEWMLCRFVIMDIDFEERKGGKLRGEREELSNSKKIHSRSMLVRYILWLAFYLFQEKRKRESFLEGHYRDWKGEKESFFDAIYPTISESRSGRREIVSKEEEGESAINGSRGRGTQKSDLNKIDSWWDHLELNYEMREY